MRHHGSSVALKEGLRALFLIGLAGLATAVSAAGYCDLKYQATERGEWALQRSPGDHFVFRTQRKLLEPPPLDGVSAFHDAAEDAALDALTAYVTQQLPPPSRQGRLSLSRSQRPQAVRCPEGNWVVFDYEMARVSWIRSDPPAVPAAATVPLAAPVLLPATLPPVSAPPSPSASTATAPTPAPAARSPSSPGPSRAVPSTVKTFEE